MGGILLILTLIAVYILCYWSIAIETLNDKTFGFLGFYKLKSQTFHDKITVKSFYQNNKKVPPTASPAVKHFKKTYIKNARIKSSEHKPFSLYKKS